MKYEYLQVELGLREQFDGEKLDILGEEGWELIAIDNDLHDTENYDRSKAYIFKRIKK